MAAPKVCLLLSCGALLAGMTSNSAPAVHANDPRDLSGVWWIEDPEPRLTPRDGSAIPWTEAGSLQYQKNVADLASGALADAAVSRCLPEGLPRAMTGPYPMQIVQRKNFLAVIQESNRVFWFVDLHGAHPAKDDLDFTFMGNNIGRWEGDTLVIDGVGFKDGSFIDATGVPLSEQLHVVQRLTKKQGGRSLEDVMTIEDPVMFTHPWTVSRTYELRPDVRIMEYTCGEPHRALTGKRAKAARLNWVPK